MPRNVGARLVKSIPIITETEQDKERSLSADKGRQASFVPPWMTKTAESAPDENDMANQQLIQHPFVHSSR